MSLTFPTRHVGRGHARPAPDGDGRVARRWWTRDRDTGSVDVHAGTEVREIGPVIVAVGGTNSDDLMVSSDGREVTQKA